MKTRLAATKQEMHQHSRMPLGKFQFCSFYFMGELQENRVSNGIIGILMKAQWLF